ncbi:hypothetical protein [Pyxidicoccus trucidator]|uniref:hypothetical protein n=1 Tax=Pyxidicoccus trucidator TaxID=2709662 RepID=UPI001F07541E|nr:hypothetical protein [Pyxidicoccus trucidator]
MKATHWRRHLVTLAAGLSLSCATAAVTCMDSVTCCIEAHPVTPEACGLTAAEAATLMAASVAATGTHSSTEEWDDSHNASLPEWKRRCIRAYGDCKEFGWSGSCHDCFRYCEGQHEWPEDRCTPPKKPR